MVGLTERNFCDGIEMKFTPPLGDIQQAGGPETPAKSVAPVFLSVSDCKHLDTRLYFIIINFHKVKTSGKSQPLYEFSSIYTVHNV